jgi:hypothetical protein
MPLGRPARRRDWRGHGKKSVNPEMDSEEQRPHGGSLKEVSMPTRREMVLGGALALISQGCACAQTRAQARADGRHGFGCMLDAEEAEPLLARAGALESFDHSHEKLFASSGNRNLDYALAQMLSRICDVFGVLPGFCFYDDHEGANAFATTAVRMGRTDGTVLFGKRYLLKCLSAKESPDAVVAATCAHEFGHIVQYKYKLAAVLKRGQETVRRAELNADFFAGYFAGVSKLRQPDYPAAVFATNRYARGDYSNDKQHHGTPQERAASVVRGFETAYHQRRSFTDAIQIGMNYAMQL